MASTETEIQIVTENVIEIQIESVTETQWIESVTWTLTLTEIETQSIEIVTETEIQSIEIRNVTGTETETTEKIEKIEKIEKTLGPPEKAGGVATVDGGAGGEAASSWIRWHHGCDAFVVTRQPARALDDGAGAAG